MMRDVVATVGAGGLSSAGLVIAIAGFLSLMAWLALGRKENWADWSQLPLDEPLTRTPANMQEASDE